MNIKLAFLLTTCSLGVKLLQILGRGDLKITGPLVISIQEMVVLYYPCLNRNLGCFLPPLATLPPLTHSSLGHPLPVGSTQNLTLWHSPLAIVLAGLILPPCYTVSAATLGLWSWCSSPIAREMLSVAPLAHGLAGLATWAGYFFLGPPHFSNLNSSSDAPANFWCPFACALIWICVETGFRHYGFFSNNCRIFVLLIAQHLAYLRPHVILF